MAALSESPGDSEGHARKWGIGHAFRQTPNAGSSALRPRPLTASKAGSGSLSTWGRVAQYGFFAGDHGLKIFELNPRFVGPGLPGGFVRKRCAGRRCGPRGVKRAIIIFALAAIIALPFVLRPKRPTPAQADDTVVIVTPHNEAIRHEFALGFMDWYKAKTGRTVYVDWRVLGGTSEIARYLEGEYVASFENYWTNKLHKPWSGVVQGSFQNARLSPDASAEAKEARAAFLASDVGCAIDIFFGGGSPDFDGQAFAGRMIASDLGKRHPDWFTDAVIPQVNSGNVYWDPQLRWIGSVISLYGILYNRDGLTRLGIAKEPDQWMDLADPRYLSVKSP